MVSVYVTGRHLDKLPARAGQLCFGGSPGTTTGGQPLSAAPGGIGLCLTAKAAGSTSAGLRNVQVGSRAFVEGPYGAFTSLHRTRPSDLGLGHFAVLSDGTKIDAPRFLRRAEKKLKREQRRLFRRVKGSKNRDKARIKAAPRSRVGGRRTARVPPLALNEDHSRSPGDCR